MDSKNYTDNIVEYVTYGIEEHIKPDETVEVNLRDLMFVAATLRELIRKMLPQYVDDLFGEGVFDSPEMPYYFKAKD